MERCPHCGQELAVPHEKCPTCGLTMAQTDFAGLADQTLLGAPPAQTDEQALAEGRVLGGRYEIIAVLGRGGMGWVYTARDREIDKVVALKVIRKELANDEDVIRRFRDEIILARKVTHKNVLRIYDIAEADGIKFISMPYIKGRDLKDIIDERGPLAIDEAVNIARQVASALKCAHEAGVIHRDLKPQNIMIDDEGTAYVTDFGIAKSVEAGGITMTGQIMGTPDYMSPEQAEGKQVDYRTDIYSFGLVLYEMLTGLVPFKADTIITTLMRRLREHAEPPSSLNPAVPGWLDRLTMKSLERDLENRYASADQVLADIESQTVKLRRRIGRRTMAVILAVAVVGAAAGLFFGLKPSLVFQKARTYVAVLPFENMTNDAELDWLTSGIPDNLTADLAQSKFFRVMSPERLRQTAKEMGTGIGDLANSEVISRLAKATDIDAVVVGSFARVGEEVRITLKVENARNQELIGTRSAQGLAGDLLAVIDQLAGYTKQIFKLSQKDIDADLNNGGAVERTKSVRAASEFARGLNLSYQGSYLDAAKAFEAAITADPDFAMAYAEAADAYKTLGYDDKAASLSFTAVDKAVKFMDRVPPADRTFIMAGHANITHNADEAVKSYTEFISAYPDNPEGYYNLGLTYVSVSDWGAAARNFKKAIGLDPKFGSAHFELGKAMINQNTLDEALSELETARKLYEGIGNRQGEAAVLNAIGVLHKRKNEFAKAMEYYDASMKIKEELGDKRGMAASLGNIALLYEIMGERDQALAALERSLEIRKEIGDKVGISNALNKIGQIYQSDGKFEEALANYERSYEIRREVGSKDLMASSLSDMGSIYAMMGRYDKAAEMDSLALVLRSETGDARDKAESLRNISETLIDRGKLREARTLLAEASATDDRTGDQRVIARDRQSFARYYLFKGTPDSALAILAEALKAQESIEEKPAAALTTYLLGAANLLKGDYKRALGSFDNAVGMAREIRERELAAEALIGKAQVFFELGYPAGMDSVLTALGEYDEATLSHQLKCHLKEVKAQRLFAAGRFAETRQACGEVVAAIGHEDVRCRGAAELLAAEADLASGEAAAASNALRGIHADAAASGLRWLEAASGRLLAQASSKLGLGQAAVEQADEALKVAGELGISDVDYLFTCGDARLVAGDRDGAASYYGRALDGAVLALDQRCPRRLRQPYVGAKNIAKYITTLADLPAGTPKATSDRDYQARFGLK
jgi:tetratricopeptide (TPR) repeat protein